MTHPYFFMPLKMPHACVAVTTRYQSPEKEAEFNLSNNQEDMAGLTRNLTRLKKDLNLAGLSMLRQVHGDELVEVREENLDNPPQADGLYTTVKGLGIMVRQADCQAVVLSAPGLLANLHVGWRGNVQNLPGKALKFLSSKYAVAPKEFRASISPSLGPCCAEFVNYQKEMPPEFWPFRVNADHFNLWAITAWQLHSQGLPYANLTISGVCTKSNPDFYSYRRGDAGRFATIATLQD